MAKRLLPATLVKGAGGKITAVMVKDGYITFTVRAAAKDGVLYIAAVDGATMPLQGSGRELQILRSAERALASQGRKRKKKPLT